MSRREAGGNVEEDVQKPANKLKLKSLKITRQPQGKVCRRYPELEITLECEVEGEGVVFQWWHVTNGSTVKLKSTVNLESTVSHCLCVCEGLVFCVVKSSRQEQCVSDLVELSFERQPINLPTWPARIARCIPPLPPSSPLVDEYMAQFKTDGPSAPFFSTHDSSSVSSENGDVFTHSRILMEAGFSHHDTRYIIRALDEALSLSSEMALYREYFVEDPMAAEKKKRSHRVKGQYHADLAILRRLSPSVLCPLVLIEQKSGKAATKEGALNQVMRIYQSFRRDLEWKDKAEKVALRGLFLCYLMTFVKRKIHLYGVATHWVGDRERISHSLLCSCSTASEDMSQWIKLASMLRSGIHQLNEFWMSIKDGGEDSQSPFPVAKPPSEQFPSFEYTQAINSKVFEAKAGEKSLIVKFTKMSYPGEVHTSCYEKGVAPELLYWNKTELYTMVVMEKVLGAITLDEYLNEDRRGFADPAVVIKSVEGALYDIHSLGYVHGDFRGSNILVRPDGTVKIVDFDWCCLEGKGKYDQLSNFYMWPCMMGDNLKQCHDLYFLAGYKRKIRDMFM
eukprot:m.279123 g.279123  ORF g.279123 m.279123 type:complete len:564 (+) comp40621_c0_seq3:111-1802(+)